ncbi:MAG: triose-phosphate isomerase [Methanocellales archaeon]
MKIKPPVIVLNLKAYLESVGEKGLTLARACEEVAMESGISIAICPQTADLAWIARQVKIPCLAQHVDAVPPGSYTGWVTLESIKSAGAIGTLLNHSEHRLRIADIDEIINRAKALDLLTIVCTNNLAVSKAVAALAPYALAVEPPQLIGSGIPVSKAEPEIVRGTVQAVKAINKDVTVLCGAGITTGEDVKAAIELGSEGVLLASGVVKAKNPKAVLQDLVSLL